MANRHDLRSTCIRAGLSLSAWAGVHSLLAATPTKRLVRSRLGERRAAGLYRLGFNGIAVASFGALVLYLWRLPDRRLYTVRSRLRALMLGVQVLLLGIVLHGMLQVGLGLFSGLTQLYDLLADRPVSPTPEAQHPLPKGDDLGWRGGYRLSRHPNNYYILAIFWLSPVMTVKWATVGLVSAVYMVLGSLHEGRRLLGAYGDRYRRYRREAPHLLLPVGRWVERARSGR